MAQTSADVDDICRFCRSEATPDKPLYHPCVCAGSIKYIHQDCLVHWLKYSEKEYCELCNHRFSFTNIYSPDMPKRLPLSVLLFGIFKNSARALQRWVHLALVTLAWGVLAPVVACRLYKLFLYDSLPSGMYEHLLFLFTTSDIINDIFHGCCIVSCSMVAFISLAWLRDQIIRHGGPEWQEFRDIEAHQDGMDEDDEEENDEEEEDTTRPIMQVHNVISDTINEEIYFDTSDSIINNEIIDARTRSENDPTINSHLMDPATIAHSTSSNPNADPISQSLASLHDTPPLELNPAIQSPLDLALTMSMRDTENNHRLPNPTSITSSHNLPERESNSNSAPSTQPGPSPSSSRALSPTNNNISANHRIEQESGAQIDVEVNENENNNWNNDWEMNEDISWERIVGLDGSFIYVQHVFWVILLNFGFIILFAFLPYNSGWFIIDSLGLKLYVAMAPFHGFITSVVGYISLGIFAVIASALARLAKLRRLARWLNFSYIIIRITILMVFELGILPFLCGWLLDISTLPLVNGSIQDRYHQLVTSVYLSTTIHWALGLFYAFNFVLFICLLKEVVKARFLSFLFHSFEDPSYNPIPDIIRESIWQFIRGFIGITFLMAASIFLIAYLPVRAIGCILPNFLPYVVSINNELTELTIEFFMLLLLLPTVVDYNNFRNWLTTVIKFWCIHVAKFLALEKYLLKPHIIKPNRENSGNSETSSSSLMAANTSNNHVHQEQESEAEQLDDHLVLKIIALSLLVGLTLFFVGLLVITVPALIGRLVLGLWFGPKMKIHECNTISLGLFICFIILRLCTTLYSSLPLSLESITAQANRWIVITSKAAIVTVFFLGLIPFLVGLLFDVTLIIPRRVGNNQTPIFYLWQDWIFGILLTKLIGVMLMLSPGRMREALEELYQGGMANFQLQLLFSRLAVPIILFLASYLSIPYIAANLVLPYLGVDPYTISHINRDMYGWLMYTILGIKLGSWQFQQFTVLHDNIRNERYMVGRRLVNYHR